MCDNSSLFGYVIILKTFKRQTVSFEMSKAVDLRKLVAAEMINWSDDCLYSRKLNKSVGLRD